MAVRGLWPFVYSSEVDASHDPRGRVASGLRALKRELIYNGFAIGLDPQQPLFCSATDRQTALFQKKVGLADDGIIGPLTGSRLFDARIKAIAYTVGVNGTWLRKLIIARSQGDPVAQGVQEEEGIAQIELEFNPLISLEQAWDPAWALDYAAHRLKTAVAFCDDEEGGIAAWSVGRIFAKQWVDAGKPDDGGPEIGQEVAYKRATFYVERVSSC